MNLNIISNQFKLIPFKMNFFSMKFLDLFFDKSALHVAVEKENIEIVILLLSCSKIDVNLTRIK